VRKFKQSGLSRECTEHEPKVLTVKLLMSRMLDMITSEWLNVGWWNLAVTCILQKSRPSSNVKVKGQRSRSPGTKTKNEKVRHFVWQSSSGARSSFSIFTGTVLAGAATPVGNLAHAVYRQHCAKRKAPVFNLLRGRFWGFFAPQGRHVAPMGVKFDTDRGPLLHAKFHPQRCNG